MQEVAGYRPVMYGLEPGDKVEYTQNYKAGAKRKKIVRNCTVVNETERLIILDTGNYRVTVDKRDIGKDIELCRLEDENMFKNEPKITPEQLLEECRTHGTDKDAEKTIAILYGLSPLTIKQYISQWKIKDKLNAEEQPKLNEDIKDLGELAMEAKRAASEFTVEPEPKPNLDLLKNDYIGVKGEIYNYEITQYGIKITDGESRSQILSIGDFDKLIQEFQAVRVKRQEFFREGQV